MFLRPSRGGVVTVGENAFTRSPYGMQRIALVASAGGKVTDRNTAALPCLGREPFRQ